MNRRTGGVFIGKNWRSNDIRKSHHTKVNKTEETNSNLEETKREEKVQGNNIARKRLPGAHVS